ncbi:CRISPR-associated endonuclease Cas2 [Streptomyces sp. NPDC057939]|uniref:CRISPR-associated endonuclease Cas2 n=1 Tax=Streptomyces sp. NPDC057939 TaxID=3346284 RepID=UPI0036F0DD51
MVRILRTCRQYLHHVQRSVFEGHLSHAKFHLLQHAVEAIIDLSYDNVLVHTLPPGAMPQPLAWGQPNPPQVTSCDSKPPKPFPGRQAGFQRHTGPDDTTGGLLQNGSHRYPPASL